MIKLPFNFTTLALLLSVLSLASTQAQVENKAVSLRMLAFDILEDNRNIDLIEFDKEKKGKPKATEVNLRKNNFTGPFLSKTRALTFYSKTELSAGNPKLVGEVTLPESLGKKVLLVANVDKDKRYSFFAMADNFDDFKRGETKLFNLTPIDIAAKINDKPVILKPNTVTKVAPFAAAAKNQTYPVEFHYRKDKKWNPFSSSMWFHEADIRFLTFIYLDVKDRRIRVKTIRDLSKPDEQP